MDRSDKLKPYVIGKSVKPRAFQGVQELACTYYANKKAWMTTELFKKKMHAFDARMGVRNHKVVLIIDRYPAHATVQLRNVELVFLPPNCTSVLQPFDLGVSRLLKIHFRSMLVQYVMQKIKTGKQLVKRIVLDTLQKLECWETVKEKLEVPVSFDEFVLTDVDVEVCCELTDAKFVNFVTKRGSSDDDDEDSATTNSGGKSTLQVTDFAPSENGKVLRASQLQFRTKQANQQRATASLSASGPEISSPRAKRQVRRYIHVTSQAPPLRGRAPAPHRVPMVGRSKYKRHPDQAQESQRASLCGSSSSRLRTLETTSAAVLSCNTPCKQHPVNSTAANVLLALSAMMDPSTTDGDPAAGQVEDHAKHNLWDCLWMAHASITIGVGRGNGRSQRKHADQRHCPATSENPVTRPGIEPGSPWWEASVLIAQPPWPPVRRKGVGCSIRPLGVGLLQAVRESNPMVRRIDMPARLGSSILLTIRVAKISDASNTKWVK
ncbi:hypothetical protein PR048_026408 [Dryococelus australis]|uniref:DDE-1 domain-containing protein n=1 Tax=Dryococelus australis TaxID=614101 RepID=A0ABQ9GL86_9NEOP|nr:hypothetical protein PR048_026408 [Dryococelus australis]